MGYKVVFIRHGQSLWNKENRFTGWTDIDLSSEGVEEALQAGKLLKDAGFQFDSAHTSVLKRAIRTLWGVLDVMDQMWIPVSRSWRLNERHYGALQGLNKKETAAKHGEEQVHLWRRSYSLLPPLLDSSDERNPALDRKYAGVTAKELPLGESLETTVSRVVPYWEAAIAPEIRAGKSVLVVAHGNSLRALVQYLEKLSEEEIMALNIPTGVPLVYELDAELNPTGKQYLGDLDAIQAAIQAVGSQGKA